MGSRRQKVQLTDKQFWAEVRGLLDDKVGGGAYADGTTWTRDATMQGMDSWFGREEHPDPNDMAERFLQENLTPRSCGGRHG